MAKSVQARGVLSAAIVSEIANKFNGVAAQIASSQSFIDEAKASRLSSLVSTCSNLLPVTATVWEGVTAAGFETFQADRRFEKRDAKGVSLSARSQWSEVKVAVMALTHGLAPLANESFQAFVKRSRPFCIKKGLIDAPSAASQERAAQKKSLEPSRVTPASKGVTMTPELAFKVASNNDDAFAAKLKMVATDATYRAWFEKAFDKYALAVKALADAS